MEVVSEGCFDYMDGGEAGAYHFGFGGLDPLDICDMGVSVSGESLELCLKSIGVGVELKLVIGGRINKTEYTALNPYDTIGNVNVVSTGVNITGKLR